jgi:hypothetical protein
VLAFTLQLVPLCSSMHFLMPNAAVASLRTTRWSLPSKRQAA